MLATLRIQSRTSMSSTIEVPSITMQVRRPVANAPVSILIRFDRISVVSTGVCSCTINFSNRCSQERNSSRIQSRSSSLCFRSGTPGRIPAWTKQKVPATEREIEGFQKFNMPFGYRHGQFFGQPCSFTRVRINRRLKPVGHKSFETAAESPFIKNCWLAQKAMNEGLVIASQKNRFFCPLVS